MTRIETDELKETKIKAIMASIENKVRNAYNSGFQSGYQEGLSDKDKDRTRLAEQVDTLLEKIKECPNVRDLVKWTIIEKPVSVSSKAHCGKCDVGYCKRSRMKKTLNLSKYGLGGLYDEEIAALKKFMQCEIIYDEEHFDMELPTETELLYDGEILETPILEGESCAHYFCRLRDTVEVLLDEALREEEEFDSLHQHRS